MTYVNVYDFRKSHGGECNFPYYHFAKRLFYYIYILIIFNFYYIFKFFNKILTYQIIFIINNKMNSFICKYNYHNYQFSYLFN